MNQFKKKMYDLSGPKTAEALNKRRFEAYYCSTAEEAVEKALELIPREDTVSWGGAMTVDELGLKQRLAQEGYTLLDRDTAKTPEEKQAIMRQALTCGTGAVIDCVLDIDEMVRPMVAAGSPITDFLLKEAAK